jgi:peptide chain release factor 3
VSLNSEISRRRTFAIISHPDAGKTTLTEKFLLYGGALQLAGSVRASKNQRAVTSDWMELEKKRGISVTSTVLQIEYKGCVVNLLDTPGHKDFSEDTYRVLTAVDAALMVIDAGKGIEAQTRKLFEVCRRRGIPIFTFMNKCDRPIREPLALIDELESVLGLKACPVNWPLGGGPEFRGVFDRLSRAVHMFERVPGGAYRAPVSIGDLGDPFVAENLDESIRTQVEEEIEMLDMAGEKFDHEAVLAGEQSPVFFGSAVNNFGIQLLLDQFLDLAPSPSTRMGSGMKVEPNDNAFSGFIFKIQANMDPRHRDRLTFIRICSGRFERDMWVVNTRTGRRHRLSSSHRLFGQERETMNEGFAGDILGLIGHSEFRIGDTLSENPNIRFEEMPRFAPECFAFLANPNKSSDKRFRTGLDQLMQEGVVQSLKLRNSLNPVPLLAAVGPLQFDVFRHRLQGEYNAESKLEIAPWNAIAWVDFDGKEPDFDSLVMPSGSAIAFDTAGMPVVLFPTDWMVRFFEDKNSGIYLHRLPPDAVSADAAASS